MYMTVDERLMQFLKDGKDWERKATNIPGVFLIKLPTFRGKPASLAIGDRSSNAFLQALQQRKEEL